MPSTYFAVAKRTPRIATLLALAVVWACDSSEPSAPLLPSGAMDATLDAAAGNAGVVPIDLGTLGGAYSSGAAINAFGVIVGNSTRADGSLTMFLRDADGVTHDVGAPSFAQFAFPAAINDAGVVVGATDNPRVAFRWSARDGFQSLGSLGGESMASDVNEAGVIVGTSYLAAGGSQYHAFLWSADTGMIDLGTLGGSQSNAVAINDRGEIVGGSDDISGTPRATLWKLGQRARDLLAPSYANYASDINHDSDIIGGFQPGDGTTPGYLMRSVGAPLTLPLYREGWFVEPIAISNAGDIVAIANTARTSLGSFVQKSGKRRELLPLPGGSDAIVRDVNRCGRAVGWSGTASGTQHAVEWRSRC